MVIIRFYGNSYSAINTPKGTRVQQEIRTTRTRKEITAITGNDSGDTFAKSNTSKQMLRGR